MSVHPKQPVRSCMHAALVPLPCTEGQLQYANDNMVSPSLQQHPFSRVEFTVSMLYKIDLKHFIYKYNYLYTMDQFAKCSVG